MSFRFFLVLFFLCVSFPLFGQWKVIEGDRVIEIPDSLTSISLVDAPDVFQLWMYEDGYLNGRVIQVERDSIIVSRGCRVETGFVYLRTDSLISEEKSPFTYLTKSSIETYMKGLRAELINDGYLYHSIVLEEIKQVGECVFDVYLRIEKNSPVRAGSILFSGNTINKDEYLTRISGFKSNEPVNELNLTKWRRNLVTSNMFRTVSDPVVVEEEGDPLVLFRVEERALNTFDGILGFVPSPDGGGDVVGEGVVALWNVFSQGNGVNLAFRRLQPEVTRLSASVHQQWIGSIPLGGSVYMNLFQNDTTYQSRNGGLTAWYQLSPGIRITGGVQFSSSIQGSDPDRFIEPDGDRRLAELGFEYSTLDNAELPRSGLYMKAGFGVATKNVDIDSVSGINQQVLNSLIEWYVPITNKSNLLFRSTSYLIAADEVTDSDLYRFGGAKSLRGFREEQFQASQVSWTDAEYRFLLNPSSYLFGFGSIGWFERPRLLTESTAQFQTSDWLTALGFGLSYRTAAGRLTFTYALTPEESAANGVIHVGFITDL
ncbi:MAG: BamA/TamA family outer membrane protein [Bacteroidota bacterium]